MNQNFSEYYTDTTDVGELDSFYSEKDNPHHILEYPEKKKNWFSQENKKEESLLELNLKVMSSDFEESILNNVLENSLHTSLLKINETLEDTDSESLLLKVEKKSLNKSFYQCRSIKNSDLKSQCKSLKTIKYDDQSSTKDLDFYNDQISQKDEVKSEFKINLEENNADLKQDLLSESDSIILIKKSQKNGFKFENILDKEYLNNTFSDSTSTKRRSFDSLERFNKFKRDLSELNIPKINKLKHEKRNIVQTILLNDNSSIQEALSNIKKRNPELSKSDINFVKQHYEMIYRPMYCLHKRDPILRKKLFIRKKLLRLKNDYLNRFIPDNFNN